MGEGEIDVGPKGLGRCLEHEARETEPIQREVVGQQAMLPVPTEAGTPAALLTLAVQRDLDLDKLERLVELKRQWDADQARKAFYEALTKCQSLVPPLPKDKKIAFGNTSYKYATLGAIAEAIKAPLRQCGLSYRYEIEDTPEALAVTCIITHVQGHAERTTMSAPPDTSGSKNVIQSRGSTIAYMQRYTLAPALGLVTIDEDDDGRQGRVAGPARQREPAEPASPLPAQAAGTDRITWVQPRREWWYEKDSRQLLVDDEAAGRTAGRAYWKKVMLASQNPEGSRRSYCHTLSNPEVQGWAQGSVVTCHHDGEMEIWEPVKGKPRRIRAHVISKVRPAKPTAEAEAEPEPEPEAAGDADALLVALEDWEKQLSPEGWDACCEGVLGLFGDVPVRPSARTPAAKRVQLIAACEARLQAEEGGGEDERRRAQGDGEPTQEGAETGQDGAAGEEGLDVDGDLRF